MTKFYLPFDFKGLVNSFTAEPLYTYEIGGFKLFVVKAMQTATYLPPLQNLSAIRT